jgi:DNA primase
MTSGDSVQRIKDRLNIVDVISPYVELQKAGRHFKGKSPFTNERTPSFYVSPDKGMYYCFSTSQGGDMFKFIEVVEGVDFKGALKLLAEKAGVELIPERPEKRNEREQLYAVMEAAASWFMSQLRISSQANAYLEKRGVQLDTIERWQIGYAPGPPTGGWRELRTYLHTAGFTDDILSKAGLIKSAGVGKEPFDTFRDRVMFPLRDQSGRVVAFSGRLLTPNDKAPKYVNSPETELYHKSDLLYGYDFAKQHIRQLPFWLIVEGQFDVVMSHQAGYTTTVAVSGTAFTLTHAQQLERFSKQVVLALDADKAGQAAMKRATELLLRRGFDVKVAQLPEGADPADIVLTDVAAFKKAIGSAMPVLEYIARNIVTSVPDVRKQRLLIRDEVIPLLALLPSHLEQDHFETLLADLLAASKESIHLEVRQFQERQTNTDRMVQKTELLEKAPAVEVFPADYTRTYLEVLTSVLPPAEAAVVGPVIAQVAASAEAYVNERARFLFEAEQLLERFTKQQRQEYLVHLCAVWWQKYLREQLQITKELLAIDPSALAKIELIKQQLQTPPLTLDDLPKT